MRDNFDIDIGATSTRSKFTTPSCVAMCAQRKQRGGKRPQESKGKVGALQRGEWDWRSLVNDVHDRQLVGGEVREDKEGLGKKMEKESI